MDRARTIDAVSGVSAREPRAGEVLSGVRRTSHGLGRCDGIAVRLSRGVHAKTSRRAHSHRESSARRRTETGDRPVRRSQGLDGAARRPRSRGSAQDPRPRPAAHDGGRAPLRGHGEPGDGRRDHGALRRAAHSVNMKERTMRRCGTVSSISASRLVSVLAVALLALGMDQDVTGQPRPGAEAVMAWPLTIAPTWFDPATAPPQITPFGMLYALHDALVRPLPGQKMGNSLAESWTESPDGLRYEFKLRHGLKFHNGDAVTADDVKFSFERYKGAGAKELNLRVRQVEIIDPLTVRFLLKEPWPDFMTFYGTTATAAGIVVPKKYLTQVGDDALRKHPIGAGPYKFVSHTPGVEVVLEANPDYWRRVPTVKRLVMKSVPEATTRIAMLKKGEADMAFLLEGPNAETLLRDARFALVATRHASAMWIEFAEQWDPKSPWHDRRVRLAVNHALDRNAISETACLGYCPSVGVIVPPVMDYAL